MADKLFRKRKNQALWTAEYRRPFYAAGGGGGSPAEEWFAGRLAEKPPYVVQCTGCRSNHWTGRSCDDQSCGEHQRLAPAETLGSGQRIERTKRLPVGSTGGKLHDTIISFGDSLRDKVVEAAADAAEEAQLVLS